MKKDLEVLTSTRMMPFQFFREWLVEACVRSGIKKRKDLPLPWAVKVAIAKLGLCFPLHKKKKLLVMAGGKPEYFSWPWCYFYEIVPVVWDCWPMWLPYLIKFAKRNKTRTIFCTASVTARHLKEAIPEINAVWLPEGINVEKYPAGRPLVERNIDILEMGRIKKDVHQVLMQHKFSRKIVHKYPTESLVFPDFDSMTQGMRDCKIAICYPRSDTDPNVAGDVETLTQRYWEFMLSGALIVGRAPKELMDFCGYNPVVEIKDNIGESVEKILNNIGRYQHFVNSNRIFAEKYASWDSRIPIILEHLK